jgi:CPA2 family monovalent cation:H+ antiporter-2
MPAQHLPALVQDLAIILMTAGLVSIVCRWLKQPVILGYVISGIVVGPHTAFSATVSDIDSVKVWGEIGVIFVLFSLGLEFSFRRLLHVGGSAVITAVIETGLLLLTGATAGLLLGWQKMDAVFLGGMLCISSTMIIVKIFEEFGLKQRKFAQLVLGVLIVEDLVAVLLLVMLSTFAVTRELAGGELLLATVRLVFFIVLWCVVGLFVLPGLMRWLRRYFTHENSLIFSVGLCLMMVLIATGAGFSPALGAFVMGSLLAETDEGERIEHVIRPLRNFFGAIFFVSVGILFDPTTLPDLWPQILGLTLLLVIGKTCAVTIGGLLAGQSLQNSMRAGLSMTQIGEFSFIIASLGLSLGVISNQLFPIAVSVSLLSSCLTPFILKRSDRVLGVVENILPSHWQKAIERYHAAMLSHQGSRIVPALLRAYMPLIVVNFVMVLSTTWVARFLIFPYMQEIFGHGRDVRILGLTIDLLLCLPFFWGLCLRRPPKQWRERAKAYPRLHWVELLLQFARICFGLFLFLVVTAQYMSWQALSGVTVTVLAAAGYLFYSYGGPIYKKLENRFFGQLEKLEDREEAEAPPLLPWDTHLTQFEVSPNSPACGMSIERLGLNESFGIMIAAIDRGHRRILAPKGSDSIYPFDKLSVLGEEAAVERFKNLIEVPDTKEHVDQPLKLRSIVLEKTSPVCGKAIRNSGLRRQVDGLLVGLEREGYKRLNPSADLRLEAGDRLWIVGDPEKIARLNS